MCESAGKWILMGTARKKLWMEIAWLRRLMLALGINIGVKPAPPVSIHRSLKSGCIGLSQTPPRSFQCHRSRRLGTYFQSCLALPPFVLALAGLTARAAPSLLDNKGSRCASFVPSSYACTFMSSPTQNFFPRQTTVTPPHVAQVQTGSVSASRPSQDASQLKNGRRCLDERANGGNVDSPDAASTVLLDCSRR